MADLALFHLAQPGELPPGIRDWLMYVVSTLLDRHRRRSGAIPTAARGNAVDTVATLTRARDLYAIFRVAPDREPVTATLARAADELRQSVESLRKTYYSKLFKVVYAPHLKGRKRRRH
jgi:hypothetical protein